MITCGWCGTHYRLWQNKCDSCGGPMPPLPGMELGEPPPPCPRELPKGFALKTLLTRNVIVLVGLGFLVVGCLVLTPMLIVKTWATLFPLFFALGGFFMTRHGFLAGKQTLHAYKDGIAAQGKVASVEKDPTITVNGKHPWKLVYHFALGNSMHSGSVTSFDSTLSERKTGQPLWVLYLEEDPARNTLFPPLK